VRVERHHDARCSDRTVRSAHAARLYRERGGLFVERRTAPLGSIGHAACEFCGIDGSRVRIEDASMNRGSADASRDLFGIEPANVLLGPSDLSLGFEIRSESLCLPLTGRQDEAPTLVEVRFDPLGLADDADLVDARFDRLAQRGAALWVAFEVLLQAVDQGKAPAAVTSRCAKSRRLALDDGDAARGIGAHQVVRGPQSREAAADDRDVDFEITRQR